MFHSLLIGFRGWIKAPDNVDVIMVAPKGPGSKVRETYLDGFGTPSIVAVEQDKTGTAWDRTLGIAKGIDKKFYLNSYSSQIWPFVISSIGNGLRSPF